MPVVGGSAEEAEPDVPRARARRTAIPGTVRVGALAALAMGLLYAAVVTLASGSLDHLRDQAAADWYLLLPILAGFGVQVALMVELRRRRRLRGAVAAAGATGTGASAVGMVACCAHHVADLLPFVGATAAATFLYDYRLPFMLAGVGLNAVGIVLATRRLRSAPPDRGGHEHEEVPHACAVG